MENLKGKVLWYSERDGHGIIVSNNVEYYFDSSVLYGKVKRGDIVLFDENTKIEDCRCARNVIEIQSDLVNNLLNLK